MGALPGFGDHDALTLALRQTEGLIASLLRLLSLDLVATDHLTLS
jgi:hypothetical protein